MFQFHIALPNDNCIFKEIARLDIGCFTNKDYFKVNHVFIELNSLEIAKHDIFWEYCKKLC